MGILCDTEVTFSVERNLINNAICCIPKNGFGVVLLIQIIQKYFDSEDASGAFENRKNYSPVELTTSRPEIFHLSFTSRRTLTNILVKKLG